MTKAIICYENLLLADNVQSVTASTERTGYSVENAYDWYTTTYWSPELGHEYNYIYISFYENVTADYLAIYRHNLGTIGGYIFLEYSDDPEDWSEAQQVGSIVSAENNELIIHLFEATTARYWRVGFRSTLMYTAFYCGVVMLGNKLELYRDMPAGFVVPRQAKKDKVINQQTEGGQFVGKVIVSRGAKTTIDFRQVPQAWVRANWEAFIDHARTLPFIFSWNNTDYPEDAVYAVVNGEIPELSINDSKKQDIRLPVNCLLSGDVL